jgi:hypothetical protein
MVVVTTAMIMKVVMMVMIYPFSFHPQSLSPLILIESFFGNSFVVPLGPSVLVNFQLCNSDGFVKSPSAALRFNFVVAAYV